MTDLTVVILTKNEERIFASVWSPFVELLRDL